MSSLVDMCTTEFAKLREKGRTIFSTSSDSSPVADLGQTSRAEELSLIGHPGLSHALRINSRPPATLCSDAALSMLVDCFSP